MDSPRVIFGHVPGLCCRCAHQGQDLSHPQPCGRCFWQGAKHRKPTLTADGDGVTCGDFPRKSARPPSLKGTSRRSAG